MNFASAFVTLESRQSALHPRAAISGAEPRSQKRHGGFALLLKNSCPSATDPVSDVLPLLGRGNTVAT